MGKHPLLEYLVLSHMRDNLSHNIVAKGIIPIPVSGLIMTALRRAAEIHGITLDEAFQKRLPYLKEKI